MNYTHKWHQQGFSLLEMLIALVVTALLLHSLSSTLTAYQRVEEKNKQDTSADFQHFLALFDLEVNKYYVTQVTDSSLSLRDTLDQESFDIILHNHKIYKAPGHQPLLYGVKEWQLVQLDNLIAVTVIFTNGDVHNGLIEVALYE